MWRGKLASALLSLDGLQSSWGAASNRYSTWILAVAAILFFLDLLWKFGSANLISLVVAAVATLGAVRSIRKTLAERSQQLSRLKEDRTLWVEKNNLNVFYLALTPLAAARLVSLFGGTLALLHAHSELLILAYLALSFMLLLTHQPHEHHFMITCRRCGLKTSLILRDLCPRCDSLTRLAHSGLK